MNEAVPQQINVTAPDDLSTGNHGDISPSDMIGSQPCSTLFVANLEPHHTENDISHLFEKLVVNWEKVFKLWVFVSCRCDGFGKAKQYTKGGPPVCFVEFKVRIKVLNVVLSPSMRYLRKFLVSIGSASKCRIPSCFQCYTKQNIFYIQGLSEQ